MKVANAGASRVHDTLDNLTFDDQHPGNSDAGMELLRGLMQQPKVINPKFFYDQAGSELFDKITRLPEYYPTRTEIAILQRYRDEIAACCGAGSVVIEPGSGSSEKIRLLLDTLAPAAYVPLDISAAFLRQSAQQLAQEFPAVRIHAICADFAHNWSLPGNLPAGRRIVFYPGSTIGNLEPSAAITFLRRMRQWMGADGGMVLGVDLHKSTARLNAAYNDSAGVTAQFNLNLLEHLNRVLDAEFDPQTFRHHAFYSTQQQRIEMHLVSRRAQQIACGGDVLDFVQDETIHTENSYKYTVPGFTELAAQAGLRVAKTWLDDEQLFSVHYLCSGE
jgi:dimethylhistidine N-methyltransferase